MGKNRNVVLPKGKTLKNQVLKGLQKYNVTARTVAKSVIERQKNGEFPFLKKQYKFWEVLQGAKKQMDKRELQIAALIALQLDNYSNSDKVQKAIHPLVNSDANLYSEDLPKALASFLTHQQNEALYQILNSDWGLFGGDEYLILSIAGIWGPTAERLFGLFDKDKSGHVRSLDEASFNAVYLDDFHSGWESMTVAFLEKKELYDDPTVEFMMLETFEEIKNYLSSYQEPPHLEMDKKTEAEVNLVFGEANNYYKYAAINAYLDQRRYNPQITAKDIAISRSTVLFKLDYLIPMKEIMELKSKWSKDTRFNGRSIDLNKLNGFERRQLEHVLTNASRSALARYGFIGATNVYTELQRMLNTGVVDFPHYVAICLSCAIRARAAFELGNLKD